MLRKIVMMGALASLMALPTQAPAWGRGGGFRHGGWGGGWGGGFGRAGYWGGPRLGYGGWGYRPYYRPVIYGAYTGCYRLRPVWTGWGWTQTWVNVCGYNGWGYYSGWGW